MSSSDWLMFAATLGAGTLTAFATVLAIYFTNKKTSEAQEQNVRIQLFEKRYEIYSSLNTSHRFVKLVFSKTVINPSTGDFLPPKKSFMLILFGETEFKTKEAKETIINYNPTYYEKTEDYLHMLNGKLQHILTIEPKNSEHAKELEQIKNKFIGHIDSISGIVNQINSEHVKLGLAKHIYSDIDFEKLKSFADAFSNAISVVSDYNIAKLGEAHKDFEEAKILEKMEELLKP
jgi:hypothetical protein